MSDGYDCFLQQTSAKKWLHNGKYSLYVLLLFCFSHSDAQLCTGSLGDPIVNIDFGSGTGRGAALGSSVTAYTYSASGDLGEGVYTIANTTSGLKSNAWHTTTDHTGNTNGYMMVVNCAILATEGVFYTKSVSGLCPNTTYEFSAWLMNIMVSNSPDPNVTFKVSTTGGTLLGSYTTGDIPVTSSPTWKQYGFYFTTGTETEVVIKILNSAPSAVPGNDLALDDIKFRPCGPQITISMNSGLTSQEVCEGAASSFTFNGTVSTGYTNPSYQWQVSTDNGATWADIAGATTTTYTRTATSSPGTYQYRLVVASGSNISISSCRTSSNIITITVQSNPKPAASSNNIGCEGDTLRLTAAGGSIKYQWTGPLNFTSSLQSPVINGITAANNGKYYVTITTSLGCTNTDSVTVQVSKAPIANAGNDTTICEGSSITLQGDGGTSYLWTPGTGLSATDIATPIASPTDTISYILTVSNGTCRGYDTVVINVLKRPVANAGSDKKIYQGESVELKGSAGGTNVSYYWTPDYNIVTSSLLNPVVSPLTDTTYILHVESAAGCGSATDTVFVRVYKRIEIPNAFSPNGDGINDTWSISQMNTYPEGNVSLFNRNGQILFHSTGYNRPWDGTYNGKPVPVGTYYYIIDLKNGLSKFSGWILVIR